VPVQPAEPTGVCVVGSANLDVVATVDRLPKPGETLLGGHYREYAGGKGLNQAIAASRSGAPTSFVGAIGPDAAAATLRAVLEGDAIDTAALATSTLPTGRAVIFVDGNGENVIVVVPGANATVVGPSDLSRVSVLLTQLEVPITAVRSALQAGRAGGATTILNPAPAADLDHDLLGLCDIVVPNEHEVELLGGVDRLHERGVGTVIVTLGARGAEVHRTDGSWRQAPFEVEPVDTTGAGDAFCGSLAARIASGSDLTAAVRWAAAAGALATTVSGAVPAQPRAAAIEALLATQPV
jgi:ribokinase